MPASDIISRVLFYSCCIFRYDRWTKLHWKSSKTVRLHGITFRLHLWLTDSISQALISSAHVRDKIWILKGKPFRPPSRVQHTLSLNPWIKINAWLRFSHRNTYVRIRIKFNLTCMGASKSTWG